MGQRNVRIVVGRGDPSGTDIRATLEDDGFQVAGEASSAAELARLVSADPPDVVVLDDTIGVAAVQAVTELAPDAKLVVIWPAAVLPIAGATRIDAAQMHTALAPAVAAAAGFAIGMTTIDRPEWIDAVRKDPATLREKLAESGGTHPQPSVTELQRPHAHRAATTGWRRRRTAAAAVAAAAATVGAPATPAATADADTTVNRRLGIVALGGAVAAGALMIALSFGRTPPTLVTAERFVPGVSAPSNVVPNPPDGSTTGGGSPGAASGGGQQAGGGGTNGGTGTGGGAGAPTIGAGGTTFGTSGSGSTGGRTGQQFPQRQGVGGGGPSTSGSGGPSTGDGGEPSTGDGSSPGADGSGNGQAGGNGATSAPGKSGEHNPHGGPPGQLHHGGHGHGAGHGHAGHPDHPDHPDRPDHLSHRVRP